MLTALRTAHAGFQGALPLAHVSSNLGGNLNDKKACTHCRRYLANKYPEKGLGGTDAKSRALVDNWMEAEAQNLDPYTGVRQTSYLQGI
jgi:hypothetical protein